MHLLLLVIYNLRTFLIITEIISINGISVKIFKFRIVTNTRMMEMSY
jgi:hypothetical protein